MYSDVVIRNEGDVIMELLHTILRCELLCLGLLSDFMWIEHYKRATSQTVKETLEKDVASLARVCFQ